MTIGETSTSSITDLVARILDRRAEIAVFGQGYVGLSLACGGAERGFSMVGIDVDRTRIQELDAGLLMVPGVNQQDFTTSLASGRLRFTSNPEAKRWSP